MREKISKQPPPAPTASAIGPCPTIIQISRTPRHWKFTQLLRTTRPPPIIIWSPTCRRAIKEVSKAVNLDWINNQACSLSQKIYVITNFFYNEVKCLAEEVFSIWHYILTLCQNAPIKFWRLLTNFIISIALSKKFCCQNLIMSIKVINTTGHASKSNKLRN